MGAFPNAAQCLLCSDSPNSFIYLYFSGDTSVTIEFPTDPGISTFSMHESEVSPSRRFYGDLGLKKINKINVSCCLSKSK